MSARAGNTGGTAGTGRAAGTAPATGTAPAAGTGPAAGSPRLASSALVAAIAVVAVAAGCGRGAGASATELTVFVAASLKPVLSPIATGYASVARGVTLRFSSGSSAALATQIEHGAPADVFLSADTDYPARLVGAGIATGQAVPFARNLLAIVVPEGNPGRVMGPADLVREGVRVIAANDAVPISSYAAELIDRLARLPGYPAGFVDAYARNVVSREDSVASVVAKIALGEGDAGIVYATDAAASEALETIAIPPEANVAATYAGVVVGGPRSRPASGFLGWLAGPGGQAILAAHGFLPGP